ncbi:MAG: MarR family transcriptional regulator [Actinomycetota bacterium]
MERARGLFVDGIGAAAATSGILNQLQGRIYGLLYLQPEPLSLDEICEALQQSKSNVSVNVRALVDWNLVRQIHRAGSRKDHYEAATDFWRVMREIMERRFRWNIRQVLATVAETERAATAGRSKLGKDDGAFLTSRLEGLRSFAQAVDDGVEAFAEGRPFTSEPLQRIRVIQ